MKALIHYFMIAFVITIIACNKSKNDDSSVPIAAAPDNYSSMQDFYNVNGVRIQTFNIDGTTGGNFTTPQGTKVTIPPNAFVTLSNASVTGSVKIEFKDVYKKSDMLLSQISTATFYGTPLKSGGMFFIKASQSNVAVKLATNKSITVEQPFAAVGAVEDSAMKPFAKNDSAQWMGNGSIWGLSYVDSLKVSTSNYVFSLYQFQSPEDSGSWSNSDNGAFFSAFPQTVLTLYPNDNPDTFQTDVFLVFKNENSMVHVYRYYLPPAKFPYSYAPLGLQCIVVAIGVRDSALYSSFTPITISTNQSLYFTLTKTTTQDFKDQLKALN
jgi:hypothetical protein